MQAILFEDHAWQNLLPATWIRPAATLRCGPRLLAERLADQLADVGLRVTGMWCRAVVAELARREQACSVLEPPKPAETALLVNARMLADAPALAALSAIEANTCWLAGDVLLAARLDAGLLHRLRPEMPAERIGSELAFELGLRAVQPPSASLLPNAFGLIGLIRPEIAAHFARCGPLAPTCPHPLAVIHPDRVHVAASARLGAFVVLDASAGEILIDDGALIGHGSVLIGPVWVGPGCTVQPLTRLRGDVALGPRCKVGGELEAVVFQSLANKQHDGFLGHSWVGSFVNMGAGTTCSDLKNTYGPIASPPFTRERLGGSALGPWASLGQFAGCVVGDHARLGIGTMIGCGTAIGVGAQVADDRPPRCVPSFSWRVPGRRPVRAELDRFEQGVRRMMARRQMPYDSAWQDSLRAAFASSNSVEAQEA